MKNNPLFVDSTKFHGDLINTQFELRRILIYDDESLYVIVSTAQGETRRVAMKALDENGYGARVHLNHQTLISYRFEIEKAGRALFFSRGHKTRVQYAVISDWEPTDEDPSTFETSTNSTQVMLSQSPAQSASQRDEWPRAQVVSIRSMMDKFGF